MLGPELPGRNWTDQGTKELRGTVERANGFGQLVEQAGGRVREMVWTMGAYDFITVFEAPDDETAAEIMMKLQRTGAEHTETLRAFTRDEAEEIVRRL